MELNMKSPSNQEIITDLRAVADELKKPPKYTEYSVYGEFNEDTVSDRFGSWPDALEAAGLLDAYEHESKGRPPIPESDLLDDIRRVADELDKTPTRNEYSVLGEYSASTIARRFDSWREGVRQAGFEPVSNQPPINKIPDEELLDDIRRVAADLGKLPTSTEYNNFGLYSHTAVKDHFGTWTEGLEKAGLDLSDRDTPANKVDSEKLLADLESVAESLGKSPSWREYREHGEYSPETLNNRFGTWSKALEKAGLEPIEPPNQWGGRNKLTKEKLLADIRNVIGKLGYPPLAKDYNEHGKHTSATVRNYFGSWSEAINALGFDMKPGERHPLEILHDIARVDDLVEGKPSTKDYKEHGKFSTATVAMKWGSWSNALRELGYKGEKSGIDEVDMLHDLVRVAYEVGRPPTHDDYDEHGEYAYRTFMSRLGSDYNELADEAWELAQEFSDPSYTIDDESIEEILA